MSISKLINDYGKIYSPYMRNLVNHLPMGQMALYKLTGNIDTVIQYSEEYDHKSRINPLRSQYPKLDSLDLALGNRELYESALEIIRNKLTEDNLDEFIRDILNKYALGMSSGLFHTTIRLAYAVEGYDIDKNLIEEVGRALAYYITAYREADLFHRTIPREKIREEIKIISHNRDLQKLLEPLDSLGQRMKALYNSKEYLEKSFTIEGEAEEKIRGLLELLIPTYLTTKNIVVLHSITGLHALIVLRKYFEDFDQAIDIFTSCVITHLLSVENLKYDEEDFDHTELSWELIKIKGSESPDIHAIKLTYSAYELYKIYGIQELKDVALKRIKYK